MPKTNKRAERILDSGETFSYWTVLALSEKIDYLKCICQCGTTKEVNVYSLTSGKSKSCGCRLQNLKSKEPL